MNPVLAIAHNTFREAIRDKILYLLLFFTVVVILGSEALAVLAIGDPRKVALDLGLAAISLGGALISVFLGLSVVAQEIQRRTVYTVVSKPISRAAFVIGKFVGVYVTVVMMTVAMTAVFLLFVHFRFAAAEPRLLMAVVLFLIEDFVLAAFAILFSCFTTPILGTLFTATIYVVGHVSYGLKMLAEYNVFEGTLSEKVLLGIYYALPNLERFNIKGVVVHGDPLPEGVILPVVYGVAYGIALLILATETFRRRDFV